LKEKIDNKPVIPSVTQKAQKVSSSSIMLIVGIIALAIGILAIRITVYFNVTISLASEKSQFKIDNVFLNCIFTVIALGLLYLIYKILPKINRNLMLVITLAFSLIVGLWWVNYIQYKPISDQSMVIYCGEKLLDNDLSTILNPGEYLNRNPHQLGFSVYIMTVFRLFATRSPLVLQRLNVIYATVCALFLYLICKEIFKEDAVQKICLILIAFFSVYFAFFCTHVYGNIPGLMFGLASLFFTLKFLNNHKIYNLIIVAVSITLAYMLKSNYEIFMCAIIIVLGLHFLQTYKKQAIAGIILVIFTMVSFKTFVYKHVENGTGYSLSEGVPMIAYIYMGIAEPVTLTPGWYTADVETIYNQSGYSKEKSAEIAKEDLKTRLEYLIENPVYTWNYFTSKLQTTWLNPTFQVFWCSTPSIMMDLDAEYNSRIANDNFIVSIICGDIEETSERVMDVFQIITFISAGVALILSFKEGELKKTLLPITFLGGFIFHLIWETKSIYVIQYFYILLPFSAYGIYQLFKIIDKKLVLILAKNKHN
jgi:hypothetical protein